jgi:hypothetical protein
MKHLLFLLMCLMSLAATAQQKYKYPRTPAVVETYRDSKGKVHTRRRVTAVPERHTVTKWHYHRGYRRASGLPVNRSQSTTH